MTSPSAPSGTKSLAAAEKATWCCPPSLANSESSSPPFTSQNLHPYFCFPVTCIHPYTHWDNSHCEAPIGIYHCIRGPWVFPSSHLISDRELIVVNSNMPTLFPTQSSLNEVFASQSPFSRPAPQARSSEYPLKRPIFSAWSVAESAKAKAGKLTDAAADKYEKASAKAQATAGKIELYSGKYYASCTVGGILACVNSLRQTTCIEHT